MVASMLSPSPTAPRREARLRGKVSGGFAGEEGRLPPDVRGTHRTEAEAPGPQRGTGSG